MSLKRGLLYPPEAIPMKGRFLAFSLPGVLWFWSASTPQMDVEFHIAASLD
jgi:hypothetical protein